jgi:hypothetical protein
MREASQLSSPRLEAAIELAVLATRTIRRWLLGQIDRLIR